MSYSGAVSQGNQSVDEPGDSGTSVIDQHSEIEGTYTTTRDLRIEGNLTGSVNCDGVLFIADGAVVDAAVDAASVIVSGKLSGTIRCRGRLEITATGSVGGEVETGALVIVEGARYEGNISMVGSSSDVSARAASIESGIENENSSDSYSLLRRFTSTPPDDPRSETSSS